MTDEEGDKLGEIVVVPAELCRMADVEFTGSLEIWAARGAAGPGLAVDRRAAGDTPVGGHLVTDHEALSIQADAALGVLAQVLERDVDALYGSAFAYSDADEEAARNVARSEPGSGP